MWKKGAGSAAGLRLRYDLRSTQGASSGEGDGDGRLGASNIVFQHSPPARLNEPHGCDKIALIEHHIMSGQWGYVPLWTTDICSW
jgi:hypothetical protein